jgi:hypothetical protein
VLPNPHRKNGIVSVWRLLLARACLDREVEQAVPAFREIDKDPRWHQYLLSRHPFTGLMRQQLLNDAIASGSASRVIAFFEGFLRENQATGQAAPGRTRSAPPGKRTYSRAEIDALYAAHREGLYKGREAEWTRQEVDIFRALREGRVMGGLSLDGSA